jgi:segregation and condensation protein B
MENGKIEAIIEAILFTMGNSVEASRLAEALELEPSQVETIVHGMMEKYEAEDRGIRIVELEHAFQLCTKTEYYDYLIRVVKQPRKYALTDVLLETLSIVAYKQPVTRVEIEKIRGVKCDHPINKLMEYGLIEEVGRLDAPGRPILFGTTEEFLRSFGVSSAGDLPRISPEQIEDFKEEAEEEIQQNLKK